MVLFVDLGLNGYLMALRCNEKIYRQMKIDKKLIKELVDI